MRRDVGEIATKTKLFLQNLVTNNFVAERGQINNLSVNSLLLNGKPLSISTNVTITPVSGQISLVQTNATNLEIGLADYGFVSNCAWANMTIDSKGRSTCTSNASPIRSVTGTANQIGVSTSSGAATISLPSAVVFPGTFTNSQFDLNFRVSNLIKIGASDTLQFANASSLRSVVIGTGAVAKAALVQDTVAIGFRAAGFGTSSLTAVMRGVTAIGSAAAFSFNDTAVGINGPTGGTYIGASAGQNDIGSSNTVFIGYQAGYASRFCNGCMFIGDRSGFFFNQIIGPPYGSITDEPNTFVGNSAGTNVATGQGNVALGFQALFQGTSAGLPYGASSAYNTALGTFALQNALGERNTAVGRAALYGSYLSSASSTVAVGFNTLYSQNSSLFAVAIGAASLANVNETVNTTCVGAATCDQGGSIYRATALGAFSNAATDGTSVGYKSFASTSCLAIGTQSTCTLTNTGIWGSSLFPYSFNTFSYACIGCNGTTPANTRTGDHSATRFFQANRQVIDDLVAGDGVTITGTGNTRTISVTALQEYHSWLKRLDARLNELEYLLWQIVDPDRPMEN